MLLNGCWIFFSVIVFVTNLVPGSVLLLLTKPALLSCLQTRAGAPLLCTLLREAWELTQNADKLA